MMSSRETLGRQHIPHKVSPERSPELLAVGPNSFESLKAEFKGWKDGSAEKAPDTQPDGLNLIPRAHGVGKHQLLQVVLWRIHA